MLCSAQVLSATNASELQTEIIPVTTGHFHTGHCSSLEAYEGCLAPVGQSYYLWKLRRVSGIEKPNLLKLVGYKLTFTDRTLT